MIDPSTTSKFSNALKFLGIVDNEGKPTDKIHLLNAEGEVLSGNLAKIVNEAYAHLLSAIKVDKAKPDHVYAYFADQNNFGYKMPQAKAASRFFVWLGNLAGLNLSEELKSILPKSDRKPRGPTKAKNKEDAVEEKATEDGNGKTEEKAQQQELKVTKTVQPPHQLPPSASNIQATITMSLDKDTPVEVWRMALRLLGLQDLPVGATQLS